MAGLGNSHAPGPRRNCLLDYRRDHARMSVRLQHEYGDIVRFRFGPFLVNQLSYPDLIRHVLTIPRSDLASGSASESTSRCCRSKSLLPPSRVRFSYTLYPDTRSPTSRLSPSYSAGAVVQPDVHRAPPQPSGSLMPGDHHRPVKHRQISLPLRKCR